MADYEAGTAFIQFTGSFKGMMDAATAEAVRDGKAFIAAFNREVEKGSVGLNLGPSTTASVKDGEEAGSRYSEGFKARVKAGGPASIKVDADTATANAQLDKLDAKAKATGNDIHVSLIGALAAIAPATLPLVATAGGALAGLIPVAATTALGIAGISDELKSGQLEGTKYAADINSLKSELSQVKQIAAGGLLSGIDKGLANSGDLFSEVNRDIGIMSGQLGNIVAGGGPALLKILTDLNPLFNTFGTAVDHGAQRLEQWAQSSDGIEHFVAYVQSELPDVEALFGELIGLVGNLAEGAAPFGGALLHDIDLFVGALDKIPVGVLQTAIPLVISLYVALKAYQGVSRIVDGITTSYGKLSTAVSTAGPRAVAAAAQQQAASEQAAAAKAEEAASVARSNLEEAESYAGLVAASENANANMVAASANAALAAQEQAAATEEAYADIAASATAAAAASEELTAAAPGIAATLGGALGPISAVVIGGGLLASMFLHSGKSAQAAAQQVNTYTEAIKADSGALGENTRQAAVNALQQAGLLEVARANDISLSSLTDAILGNGNAMSTVQGQIKAQSDAWLDLYNKHQISFKQENELEHGLAQLSDTLTGQSGDVRDSVQAYKDQQAALGETTGATKSQKAALDQLNTTLGTTVSNLLASAQSEDQFREAVLGVTQSVKDNGKSLSANSKNGLANRDALISAMQAALSYRDAQEKSGTSTKKANLTLADNIRQLEAAAINAGLSKDAVRDLVKQMGLVPRTIETKIRADVTAAEAKLKALLADIPKGTFHFNVVADYQAHESQYNPPKHAGGGTVTGPGGPTSDSVLIRASAGEEVINAKQAEKHRALLKAINAGVDGFATGGTISLGHAMTLESLGGFLSSGDLGQELLKAIRMFGQVATVTFRSVAASVAAVAKQAQTAVSRNIAAAVAPAVTSIPGLRSQLAGDTTRATTATEQMDIAKQNLALLNQHAAALAKHATALANDADKAKKQAEAITGSTAADKAAKKAAEDQAAQLQKQADAAKKVADAASKMADKGKAAYQKLADAADQATQKAIADAQALVQEIQSDFQALQQQISDFESGISGGISAGSDLATVWGQITDNVTQAQEALQEAQQAVDEATPDTTALTAAQNAQADATQRLAQANQLLTQARASGDQASITAAQREQTDAVTQLTSANDALAQAQQDVASSAGPTADQVQALADAQTAYNQAVSAQSAAGLQQQFNQILASAQQFAGDLNKLASEGANQAMIAQIAAMGPTAGDALAQALLSAGPNGIKQLASTMDQITQLAGSESDELGQVFFGAGVDSMKKLLEGIAQQFPELAAALQPYIDQLTDMFTINGSVTIGGVTIGGTPVGGSTSGTSSTSKSSGKSVTTSAQVDQYYIAYDTKTGDYYDVNPAKKTVHKLTPAQLKADLAAGASVKNVTSVPKFASGVQNFTGPAIVGDGGPELVTLHGQDVIPNNVLKDIARLYPQVTPAAALSGSALAQIAAMAQQTTLPDQITLVDANGSLLALTRVQASKVYAAGVAGAKHLERRRVGGSTLDRLATQWPS